MIKLRKDVIQPDEHVERFLEACELSKEIQKVEYILEGTYTGGVAIQDRVVARPPRRLPPRSTGNMAG
jgi:hypothetical protein